MTIRDNGDEVRRALDQWKAGVPAFVGALTRATALEAVRRVVLKTPVDTGRARGNWQIGEGAPNGAVTEETDPKGARVDGELASAINGLSGREPIYLTNALPYLPILEYGGYPQREGGTAKTTPEGFSRQAPQGMIAVTVEELRAAAPAILRIAQVTIERGE